MNGRLLAAVDGLPTLRKQIARFSASNANEPHLELIFLLVAGFAVKQLRCCGVLQVACRQLIPPAHVFIPEEDNDEKF